MPGDGRGVNHRVTAGDRGTDRGGVLNIATLDFDALRGQFRIRPTCQHAHGVAPREQLFDNCSPRNPPPPVTSIFMKWRGF